MTRSLVEQHIATLAPYVPGKPIEELERELGITNAIKLASNENPLGPSPLAIEAMRAQLLNAHVYPDGAAHKLKHTIADRFGLGVEELVIGNGSNEVLTMLARTLCVPGDHGVITDCSFVAYRVIMQAEGMVWDSAPLDAGFETSIDAILARIKPETRMVFLANPNNPTGTYTRAADLERLLDEIPPEIVVVVDEAYHEYVQAPDYASALTMRDRRERLVVARTFSKVFGLGGMRAGFGVGPAELMDYVNRVREPFNCNLMAQHAAAAALGDEAFIRRSVEVNEAGRAQLEAGLLAMASRGVSWTPSQTNFLLVHLPVEGKLVYDAMLRHGVIVRPMAGYGLPRSLRITIGTEAELARCLAALSAALDEVASQV